MANKKPYAVFQTEEEFRKALDNMYNTGYSNGHQEGRINALSHFYDLMNTEFEQKEIYSAEDEARRRNIAKWQREDEFRKHLIEEAVQKALAERKES